MDMTIGQESYRIPDCWNSFSRDQYVMLCRMIQTLKHPQAIKVNFLFYLLGLTPAADKPSDDGCFVWQKYRLIFLSAETIAEMSASVDFLFATDNDQLLLNPEIHINHFPRIAVGKKKLFGPSDKLMNVRLNEFIHADCLYQKFIMTSDPHTLNKLLACLWRTKDPQITVDSPLYRGDLRIAFNPYTLESQGGTMSFLSEQVKLGCFFFYAGSRQFIVRRFPNLFSLKASSNHPDAYMSLCYDLCNSDVSKINQILDAYVYDVFMFLENSIKNKHKS
ncbi:MAG TPA: hypothetical protein PKI34_13510 [Bacteroidales bacterium]|nr:hypothetical protein [Bacteroidales bacterium]